MLASVHIADIGRRAALKFLRRAPSPGSTPGLRSASVALVTPLSGSARRSLRLDRVSLVAFWDDATALDHFLARHPVAEQLDQGWHLRLEPLRAYGDWPGLSDDVPRSRNVPAEGPAAVLTLARFRLHRAPSFFRQSMKAEAEAVRAPGLIWATAMAKPPFVATCSLWESTRALADYAYAATSHAHPAAIGANKAKPFHHQQAFIRFRPFGSTGQLGGKNPLPADWMTGRSSGAPPSGDHAPSA